MDIPYSLSVNCHQVDYISFIIKLYFQLLNDEIFAEECREKGICLISILPDILDTGAEGRNTYLTTLRELGDKYKKRKWG